MTDINIKGMAELKRALEQLPAKLEANVMRGAMRAGAKVIADAAKDNVHTVSGALAASITRHIAPITALASSHGCSYAVGQTVP